MYPLSHFSLEILVIVYVYIYNNIANLRKLSHDATYFFFSYLSDFYTPTSLACFYSVAISGVIFCDTIAYGLRANS